MGYLLVNGTPPRATGGGEIPESAIAAAVMAACFIFSGEISSV
jgi:hypothetical protein